MAAVLLLVVSLAISVSLLCCIKPWRIWYSRSVGVQKDEKRYLRPELMTFRKHYDTLRSTIQSPDSLASTLYAKGIICEDVRDEAQLNTSTAMKRCQGLLNAVEQKINSNRCHFYHFMDILEEEPSFQDLYGLLRHTYDEMSVYNANNPVANGSSSTSHMNQQNAKIPSPAVERPVIPPHSGTSLRLLNPTLGECMNIPSRLHIHVSNYQPLQIVKAITSDSFQIEVKDDELFTPTIAVLDAATGIPLKCVVTLEGDKDAPAINVCFVSVSVRTTEVDRPKKKSHQTLYRVERKTQSRHIVNGKTRLQFSFFQANVDYVITFSVHSIIDSEELECIGYTAESAICIIHTVHRFCMVGSVWKRPSPLEYSGPCASTKFHKFMDSFTNILFEGKSDKVDSITSQVISDRKTALDTKAIVLIHQALEMMLNRGLVEEPLAKLEEVHRISQSPDTQNGLLLQAQAFRYKAYLLRLQGKLETALEFIEKTRSIYLEAAPSCDTCCMFDEEARILETLYKGNMNLQIRQRILRLLEHAIADSYYSEYWQSQAVCVVHIHKAVFHLTRTPQELPESSDYTPTEEDLDLAECHLKAAPLHTLRTEIHTYRAAYYTAMCDLHWWRHDFEKSIEYAEQGKQLCIKGNFTIILPRLEARLKQLAIIVNEQNQFDNLLQ